jgi:UDP-N-acetyl-D-glucosamine dehydrogenase
MSDRQAVAVIGLGYVGLPLAVAATEAGCRVVGYDIAHGHIERLASGVSPIEDISDLQLKEALATGNLHLTTDPAELVGCGSYVICVPTPLTV